MSHSYVDKYYVQKILICNYFFNIKILKCYNIPYLYIYIYIDNIHIKKIREVSKIYQ
jgi:hypothetical protein